jgi:hypothetical protein
MTNEFDPDNRVPNRFEESDTRSGGVLAAILVAMALVIGLLAWSPWKDSTQTANTDTTTKSGTVGSATSGGSGGGASPGGSTTAPSTSSR